MTTSNSFNRILNHTCDSGDNNNNFKIGAILVINSLVQKGREYITLCELYEILGTETDAQKTGVRWGVSAAKESGIIISTERRAVYEVR
jgi:hypothetical protein